MPDGIDKGIRRHRHTGADSSRVKYKNLDGKPPHSLQMVVFDFTTDTATGDGKFYFHIDDNLAGQSLKGVHAEVITAGTTNTLDIQIANVTQSVDMLSTKLTVDSAETGSDTAATPAVINQANSLFNLNDVGRIDIDAVHTTAAKGLIVTLELV